MRWFILAIVMALAIRANAQQQPQTCEQRVENLLSYVETLQTQRANADAEFVRLRNELRDKDKELAKLKEPTRK